MLDYVNLFSDNGEKNNDNGNSSLCHHTSHGDIDDQSMEEAWDERSDSSKRCDGLFDDVIEESITLDKLELLQSQISQLSGEMGDLNEQVCLSCYMLK